MYSMNLAKQLGRQLFGYPELLQVMVVVRAAAAARRGAARGRIVQHTHEKGMPVGATL